MLTGTDESCRWLPRFARMVRADRAFHAPHDDGTLFPPRGSLMPNGLPTQCSAASNPVWRYRDLPAG